ncbi:hypothetical protein CEUSTIGMA_g11130.t1 [Chlamydomonas eustigma]|uniref:Uncharacterized protein n=1 Tax=Chlamydomonas eustigma TaxID=1157962 RepID=A0A250XKS8_9CHLO|nr:hypothetical protein CEUSTIGMA_g11130.t1 [Chlamydomonas eustigma]|eukprot:GAX83705.1 hypothetical protein CEUSTIGMA_g11130.t1 [Chlamydomonas eustigma]
MSRKRQELYEKLQWSRQTQENLFVERSKNQIHDDTLPRIAYQVESNLAITPPSFAQRPSSREGPNPSNLHIPPHIIAENNAQMAKHGLYPHITIPFSKTTHSTMGVISGRAQRSTSSGGRNGPRELLTTLTSKQQSFGQKEVSTSGQPREQPQLSVPHRDEPANRRDPWPVSKEGQYVTYEQEREELWAQEGYSNVLCRTFRLGAPSSPTKNLKYDYPTASPRHSRSPEREEVAHPEQQRTESLSPSAHNEHSWSLDGEKIKEDSPPNLSHNKRVGGMTLNQRAAQIFLDPQAKEEYIKMQHTYFSKMLKKLRDIPGYRDLSQAPTDTLPELKTALSAVRKRDEMLQRQAAQAEKEHRKQQQVPSFDGRGREGGSGAAVFREESRETSDSSNDAESVLQSWFWFTRIASALSSAIFSYLLGN